MLNKLYRRQEVELRSKLRKLKVTEIRLLPGQTVRPKDLRSFLLSISAHLKSLEIGFIWKRWRRFSGIPAK